MLQEWQSSGIGYLLLLPLMDAVVHKFVYCALCAKHCLTVCLWHEFPISKTKLTFLSLSFLKSSTAVDDKLWIQQTIAHFLLHRNPVAVTCHIILIPLRRQQQQKSATKLHVHVTKLSPWTVSVSSFVNPLKYISACRMGRAIVVLHSLELRMLCSPCSGNLPFLLLLHKLTCSNYCY